MYTWPGCHLCDEMKEAILAAGCAQLYVLEEIDIESDPELLTRYQYEIPVLCINGVEAFRHRVRADEFEAYVASLLDRRG
jgi:glutaredoxin